MDLFAANGRIFRDPSDLFKETSWAQVMLGQGLMPRGYSVLADRVSNHQLTDFLANTRKIIEDTIFSLPTHSAYIEEHCEAGTLPLAL